VVERSLAWLVGYRRLQVRYERRADILLGFLYLACALICLKSHLRCQESGEAIAWLSRVLASASVCAWRGRTEASLSRNWRAPAAAW
jgi:hypothetical protein